MGKATDKMEMVLTEIWRTVRTKPSWELIWTLKVCAQVQVDCHSTPCC